MSEQQVARTAGAAALRGALLVGAAVLIGVLLLSKNDGILASAEEGDDSTELSIGDDDGSEVEAPSTSEEDVRVEASVPESTTTTTTAPELNLRDTSKVRIHVANGAWVGEARVGGAAGRTRDELVRLTYPVLGVSNWDVNRQEETAIYFVAGGGFQNDARQVARELGVAQSQVLPSPGPEATAILADVDVLVVLGTDTEG